MKPVAPRWIESLAFPDVIWCAIASAELIGMEKPCVALLDEPENSKFDEAAVFIPMTTPRIVTSGPPESPGWIGALVWMSPESCSDVLLDWSDAVIDWHQRDLLPDTIGLAADDRVTITHADFFAAAMGKVGFDPEHPGRTFDAILLDIDHSPRHVLHDPHADFYTHDGLTSTCAHLRPGGVFAMWSDDPPDDDFTSLLGTAFTDAEARSVWFDNPLTRGKSAATIYLGTRSPDTE